jgi:hypothetical protein
MLSIRQWVQWNREVTKHYKREKVRTITCGKYGEMHIHLINGERHTHKYNPAIEGWEKQS